MRQLLFASGFDVVWIEKGALPWSPAAREPRLLSRAGAPCVVDYDDAVIFDCEEYRRPTVRRLHGDRIMRAAAVVVSEQIGVPGSTLCRGGVQTKRADRSCSFPPVALTMRERWR